MLQRKQEIMGYTRENKKPKSTEKRGELVEEFDKKFSIAIPEKAFDALRASFLQDHKKYQKEGKLPNEGLEFYECMLFLKNEKFSIYGATDKICS